MSNENKNKNQGKGSFDGDDTDYTSDVDVDRNSGTTGQSHMNEGRTGAASGAFGQEKEMTMGGKGQGSQMGGSTGSSTRSDQGTLGGKKFDSAGGGSTDRMGPGRTRQQPHKSGGYGEGEHVTDPGTPGFGIGADVDSENLEYGTHGRRQGGSDGLDTDDLPREGSSRSNSSGIDDNDER